MEKIMFKKENSELVFNFTQEFDQHFIEVTLNGEKIAKKELFENFRAEARDGKWYLENLNIYFKRKEDADRYNAAVKERIEKDLNLDMEFLLKKREKMMCFLEAYVKSIIGERAVEFLHSFHLHNIHRSKKSSEDTETEFILKRLTDNDYARLIDAAYDWSAVKQGIYPGRIFVHVTGLYRAFPEFTIPFAASYGFNHPWFF